MTTIADNLFNDDSISDQLENDQGHKGGVSKKSDDNTVASNLYNDVQNLSDQLWGQSEPRSSDDE